jgi:hypothetical protein
MANSIIVLCARLFLALMTEGVALFYFLLSDVHNTGSQLDDLQTNPLLLNICYMQPLYYLITVLVYFIFLCFDKLEET